jgi:hypothetical protein
VAEAVEDGEKGVEGAVKKVKEGFDHAHETIKKAAEVADDAGKASSAERASEEVGKIAATTMPSAESTLPSLKIVEHSAHNTSDFTEVDRLFGKNSKPITDPKEFERQIAELTRNFEHSAKQTPNNLTSEERIIADAIHDLQKNIQPAADDDNVFSILERKAAIAV